MLLNVVNVVVYVASTHTIIINQGPHLHSICSCLSDDNSDKGNIVWLRYWENGSAFL